MVMIKILKILLDQNNPNTNPEWNNGCSVLKENELLWK